MVRSHSQPAHSNGPCSETHEGYFALQIQLQRRSSICGWNHSEHSGQRIVPLVCAPAKRKRKTESLAAISSRETINGQSASSDALGYVAVTSRSKMSDVISSLYAMMRFD